MKETNKNFIWERLSSNSISKKELFNYIRKNRIEIHDYDQDIPQTFLHVAVTNNNYILVELLLDLGCNINMINLNNETPILISLKLGYNKISELLINRGCCLLLVDIFGNSVLHNAVLYSSDYILKLLLNQHIININCRDFEGNTALHLTCKNVNSIKACYLTNSGIEKNIYNNEERTELSRAINKENYSVIYYLLSIGCKC
jgi:ankyrin repeat protein